MKGVGPGTIKALCILSNHGPLLAGDFARLMWPDSPKWNEAYKCGAYGSSRGRGMLKSGGSFLGKMRRLGLAHTIRRGTSPDFGRWEISFLGEKLLEAHSQ